MKKNMLTYVLVALVFIVLQLIMYNGGINYSLRGQLVPICAYIVMAVSLNLTVGISGELSLGHAGFMSVGAFSGVIACIAMESAVPSEPIRLALSMMVAAACAGITGVLISMPILRLKGDYLAIVTLAFGEIIKNIITCLYVGMDRNGLHFGFLSGIEGLRLGEDARIIVDGPMGVPMINRIATFTSGFVLVMVALVVVLNLIDSRPGRAIMALRDNRIAAESVGINATKYKLMAFVTSAALAGAAGALYAMNFPTIVATKFNFNTSILILVFVVLGGLGNIFGSVVAAAVLTVLPELLREFNDFRMLLYAVVLIAVMLATNNSTVQLFLLRVKKTVRTWLKRKRNHTNKDGPVHKHKDKDKDEPMDVSKGGGA